MEREVRRFFGCHLVTFPPIIKPCFFPITFLLSSESCWLLDRLFDVQRNVRDRESAVSTIQYRLSISEYEG